MVGLGRRRLGTPRRWWRGEEGGGVRTGGKDLVGGEPQPLVLRLGHGSGGTEVDVFSQGLSSDDLRDS